MLRRLRWTRSKPLKILVTAFARNGVKVFSSAAPAWPRGSTDFTMRCRLIAGAVSTSLETFVAVDVAVRVDDGARLDGATRKPPNTLHHDATDVRLDAEATSYRLHVRPFSIELGPSKPSLGSLNPSERLGPIK